MRAINIWRERLKSGPLQGVYAYARRAKRRMRGEALAGTTPYTPQPIGIEELRALAQELPDHARVYFSLALGYLETDEATDLDAVLACLRCAQTLNFESPERLQLYQAIITSRRGDAAGAQRLARPLIPHEFTEKERRMREQCLQLPTGFETISQPHSDGWQKVYTTTDWGQVDRLLVVGDDRATTASWLPEADYLLVAPQVTGLTPAAAARIDLAFTVGVGSAEAKQEAEAAGLRCERWVTIVEGA